jgi:hypothetical protein
MTEEDRKVIAAAVNNGAGDETIAIYVAPYVPGSTGHGVSIAAKVDGLARPQDRVNVAYSTAHDHYSIVITNGDLA